METTKKLGIWMDHSHAHVLEINKENIEKTVITVDSLFQDNTNGSNNQDVLHNKEKHHQLAYFNKLQETIVKYDEVLLFGPTNAKSELYNLIKENHHFDKVKIDVKDSDKLTENQEHAFVKEHFSN
jgi:hypothetical protein